MSILSIFYSIFILYSIFHESLGSDPVGDHLPCDSTFRKWFVLSVPLFVEQDQTSPIAGNPLAANTHREVSPEVI